MYDYQSTSLPPIRARQQRPSGVQVQQLYENSPVHHPQQYYPTHLRHVGGGDGTSHIGQAAISTVGTTTIGGASTLLSNNNNNNNNTTSYHNGGTVIAQPSSEQSLRKSPSGDSQASLRSTSQQKRQTNALDPETAMKSYMSKLTTFERHEIFSFSQIYFVGQNARKRQGVGGGPNNCNYDDENGYEILKIIGKGSFGLVVKCYDHKHGSQIALKIVRNEKRFHRQAQEEIRILEHLKKQDRDNTFNVIHLYEWFQFRNHICITFELLSMNLYELIKKNRFQGFSLQLVRKFAHSILQCLDALYRNKIIHCDLKPENILLKQQGRSGIKGVYEFIQDPEDSVKISV
ncbi:unnamed protein product [Didymodactylos carnosus]|uniref:dual-specificity kinase n=2 Tax=Didymodactylos carnosus TaxID=1234261 RepID=A0A813WK87_9BILA|nr:unnamed protein product [Didymodactylos carnosus]CAF3641228.1 unnamed protein product [Didymodactylos carnosus]